MRRSESSAVGRSRAGGLWGSSIGGNRGSWREEDGNRSSSRAISSSSSLSRSTLFPHPSLLAFSSPLSSKHSFRLGLQGGAGGRLGLGFKPPGVAPTKASAAAVLGEGQHPHSHPEHSSDSSARSDTSVQACPSSSRQSSMEGIDRNGRRSAWHAESHGAQPRGQGAACTAAAVAALNGGMVAGLGGLSGLSAVQALQDVGWSWSSVVEVQQLSGHGVHPTLDGGGERGGGVRGGKQQQQQQQAAGSVRNRHGGGREMSSRTYRVGVVVVAGTAGPRIARCLLRVTPVP